MADIQPIIMACSKCGLAYEPTPEYLAEFGGQDTACTSCGELILVPVPESTPLPAIDSSISPPLLAYAAPQYPQKEAVGVWQDQGYVLATRGKALPRRCPRCNEPSTARSIWLRMKWSPRMATGVRQVSRLAEAAIQEEVMLRAYFCPKHRSQYVWSQRLRWILPLGGIALAILGPMAAEYLPRWGSAVATITGILGILTFFAGVIWWRVSPFSLATVYADRRCAWIAGCCDAFIAELPSLDAALANQAAVVEQKLNELGQ